jgi:hypothetical protein
LLLAVFDDYLPAARIVKAFFSAKTLFPRAATGAILRELPIFQTERKSIETKFAEWTRVF